MSVQQLVERFSRKHLDQIQKDEWYWTGSVYDYLDLVVENPKITCTAFERVYDAILFDGTKEETRGKEKIIHYNFFDDLSGGGRDAIFGLEQALMVLVNVLKSATQQYGPEKRVLLLHGPVGSSKSTIVRLLKKGLERFSRTPKGALYSFSWKARAYHEGEDGWENIAENLYIPCPMHEDPLALIPEELREEFLTAMFSDRGKKDTVVKFKMGLCPFCRKVFQQRMEKYNHEFQQIWENDIQVRRILLSEQDRIGIGTFQPKDEKNQDSTELTGDINYRKIAEYGTDSDPRAFNFDGEFNIANRGLIEFIEVLKLDVAFLYDLLGASQEHKIKPKKFTQVSIDEVILGHTNEPEYKKLQNNEFMEALRDRTIKIDIPYVTRLSNEIEIYKKDYGEGKTYQGTAEGKIKGKHIAPHTLEMAAMWAVLTRLEEPKKANLTRLQKLKLYNGKTLPGYTEDNIKELKDEAAREGMLGISPRYVQDKIANALVVHTEENCVNPFMVMNELEEGLKHHSLINSEDLRKQYLQLMTTVKEEYEDIVKNEVQKAIAADEEALQKLSANYLDNIRAYTQKEKVKNKYTGQKEEPDERLMRSVEQKIDIPESRKDDFRREIMNYIGSLAIEGKQFDYKSNERLLKALELKLFEDQKDTIKLTSLVSGVVDETTQKKIDVVKERMINNYNYCQVCATDVLNFVASIFARGDVKKTS